MRPAAHQLRNAPATKSALIDQKVTLVSLFRTTTIFDTPVISHPSQTVEQNPHASETRTSCCRSWWRWMIQITPEHIEIELAFIEHWNCRVRRIMTAKDPRRAVRPLQPRGQSRSIFSVKTPWILGSTAVWSHRVPKIALGVLLVGFSVAAHTNQEPPPLRDVAGSTSHGGDAILIATGPTHPYKLTSVENGCRSTSTRTAHRNRRRGQRQKTTAPSWPSTGTAMGPLMTVRSYSATTRSGTGCPGLGGEVARPFTFQPMSRTRTSGSERRIVGATNAHLRFIVATLTPVSARRLVLPLRTTARDRPVSVG